jgi:hypothetical protein
MAIDLGLNGRPSSAAPIWRQLVSALDAPVDLVAVHGAIQSLLQMANPGIVARCRNVTPAFGQWIPIVALDRPGTAAKGAMEQGHPNPPSMLAIDFRLNG